MIKITYMLQIHNKTAMRLNKTIFRKDLNPVLYTVNRFIIFFGGMDNDFSPLSFNKNNIVDRKGQGFFFCFQGNLLGQSMVYSKGILQITEQALLL